MSNEEIAKIAHQANKAYCENIGDYSQNDWDDTPPPLQKSVISGVKNVLDNPTITPEESHNEWLTYKISKGWVYGKEKNTKDKTHPNLVPYHELPETEKFKDMLFITIVKLFVEESND